MLVQRAYMILTLPIRDYLIIRVIDMSGITRGYCYFSTHIREPITITAIVAWQAALPHGLWDFRMSLLGSITMTIMASILATMVLGGVSAILQQEERIILLLSCLTYLFNQIITLEELSPLSQ